MAGTGEGIDALGSDGLLPLVESTLGDAEPPRDLGDGEPLFGDHADHLVFELRGVNLAGSSHR